MALLTIACDSDGVVYDLETRWWLWYRSHRAPGDGTTKAQLFRQWDMAKSTPMGNHVYDALDEPGFFSIGPAHRGALTWLKKLNDMAQLYIVTSASGKPQAMMDKAEWYQSRAPFLDINSQLVILNDKFRFKADIVIDDRLKNVTDFLDHNTTAHGFYIRRLHGRQDKIPRNYNITEVKGLGDVYKWIVKRTKRI